MERSPLHWETAASATKELLEVSNTTHVSDLKRTRALEILLRPYFETETRQENFDIELWARILRLSGVIEYQEEDPDTIYRHAKDEYDVVARVIGATALKTGDIERVIKFCRGLERGIRTQSTIKGMEKFSKY